MVLKNKIDIRRHEAKVERMAMSSAKGSGNLVKETISRSQTMEDNLALVLVGVVGNATK